MEEQNYGFPLQEKEKWMGFLKDHGYAVVQEVISKEEVQQAKDLFWEWLEALGSGIDRKDPETWVDANWPGSGSVGFFVSYGGCHTKASWFLRTRPNVKETFKTIWNTPELITSFDTFICWRPWWNEASNKAWDPYVQNLHTDQNPSNKKGFHCVQGMIPLIDVRSDGAGGLQVVPDTNNDKAQEELIVRYPWTKNSKSDWVQLKYNDPLMGKGKLIECKAGDLILFDSRTIHGGRINQPGEQFREENKNELVRLAMTVTMVPRSFGSEFNKQRRLKAFKERIGLTHWPQEYNKSAFGTMAVNIKRQNIKYEWPTLTPEIEDLI